MTGPLVAAVVIGRNEGARLRRCIESVQAQVPVVVYVDSGSTDDSVAFARGRGVRVVELDTSVPFTAARGRNAGAFALREAGEAVDYIHFIDGDCQLVDGWVAKAVAHLEARPDLGIVTGWRAEIEPERSVYNAMCDFEWHRPAGPIEACGGDMLVRAGAFFAASGFNPQVIAAEDDEFCIRIRKAGLGIERLPLAMTRHDAAMTRFSAWWRRAVRAGHGFAQVGRMHPDHFRAERRRVWLYGLVLPGLAVLGVLLLLGGWVWAGLVLIAAFAGGYGLSWLRTVQGLQRAGLAGATARHHGVFLALSKLPNLLGMLTYHRRRLRGRDMNIIEYK